jgi:hypothetical protein
MRTISLGFILLGTIRLAGESTAIAITEPTPLIGRIWDQNAGPRSADLVAPKLVSIPHIAVGGGWNTEFSAVNCSNTFQQVQIAFFSDGLTDLQIPLSGLNSGITTANGVRISLQPMGSFTFKTDTDASSPAISGFAVVGAVDSPNENVRVFAVYRQHLNSSQEEFEAAVPQFDSVERIVFPFDNTDGHFTGIGLRSNPYSRANVLIRDENGATLWSGDLPPAFRFHWAFLLRDEFPITQGIRGTIQLSSLTPVGLSAIALRFSPGGPFASLTPVYQGLSSGFPY